MIIRTELWCGCRLLSRRRLRVQVVTATLVAATLALWIFHCPVVIAPGARQYKRQSQIATSAAYSEDGTNSYHDSNKSVSSTLTLASPPLEQQRLRGPESLSSADETIVKDAQRQPENNLPLPPFSPILALQQYMEQHGADTLRRESLIDGNAYISTRRKFAIVYYWCPDRAGNILHNMFNTITWAMITNRTILVKYDNRTNTQLDCDQVLRRAEWIPMWDEFEEQLKLNESAVVPIPIDTTRQVYDMHYHRVVLFPQIPDLVAKNRAVARNEWRHDPLALKEYSAYVNQLGDEARLQTVALYRHGVNFLFGMLYRHLFTFQDPAGRLERSLDVSGLTIALHSRHTVVGDDGSFLNQEKACLRQLLKRPERRHGCHVFLMSDRPLTVKLLSAWLEERHNCTSHVAQHDGQDASFRAVTEHGPWEGLGFIEDLESSSRARTAIVGDTHRSSFMLLNELIEYDRQVEAWRQGQEQTAELELCVLPNKRWDGYDYGPGTPTFRHHSRQADLLPVRVLEQYRAWHSIDRLQESLEADDERKYAIVHHSCPLESGDRMHQFFNGFLWSVITNRTMLLRYWDEATCQQQQRICTEINMESDCEDILQVASWISKYNDSELRLPSEAMRLTMQQLDKEYSATDAVYWPDNVPDVTNAKLVVFPIMLTKIVDFLPTHQHLLTSTEAIDRVTALYYEGADFLYGMMFSLAFQYSNLVRSATPSGFYVDPYSNERTVALFSPHVRQDPGSNVTSEISCLERVLENHMESCQVFIMSDRKETVKQLQAWLSSNSTCTSWTATHNESVGYTGLSFFQDLHFVSKAKTAFIGPAHQPSSDLLLELMSYERRFQVWKQGRDPPIISSLETCFL